MRVGAIVPLFLVGLVLAPAFADEAPAGLLMSLSGSTSPPLAAMSELPSASPLQLAAGTELTFLHYAKCKLITVTGGTLTLTRTDFAADGKVVAEKDGPCPRVHQLGANAPGTTSGGVSTYGTISRSGLRTHPLSPARAMLAPRSFTKSRRASGSGGDAALGNSAR